MVPIQEKIRGLNRITRSFHKHNDPFIRDSRFTIKEELNHFNNPKRETYIADTIKETLYPSNFPDQSYK